jgi:chromatin remodeling complex protein RSC6
MARTSKAKTTEQTESSPSPSQTASVPVLVQSAEQPKAKAPRAKKSTATSSVQSTSSSSSSTSTSTSTTTPQPEPEPVVAQSTSEEQPESTEFTELSTQSGEFLSRLNRWVSEGASLKAEFKALEKRWSRELKNAQKSKKRAKRGGNRSPSGFVKPTKISDELARFLEKPLGTEMARTEVTKEINNYIRANGLQDKDNGRKIIPDTKLSSLLKIDKGQELTYFNLQRYMSPHFPKTVKETVTSSA